MKRPARMQPAAIEAVRLGEELRDARLAQGLAVEDFAATLRIRRVYLVALEEGRFQELPAPAYAMGFVRSYARALGLDDDAMVRRFRDSSGPAVARKTDLIFPEPVPRRGVPTGAVVLVGAVLAVGAYAGWYQWSGSGARTVDQVPPPPVESVVVAPDPVPPPAAPVPATPPRPATASTNAASAPSAAQTAAPAAPPRPEESRIALRAKNDVWVQVRDRAGGQALLNRVLKAGETWPVPREGLLLNTVNAGALEMSVDGQVVTGMAPGQPPARRDVPLEVARLRAGIPAPPRPAPAAPAPPPPSRPAPAAPAPAPAPPPATPG